MSNVTDKYNQLGIIKSKQPAAPIPPKPPVKKQVDKETLLAQKLNARRDMNKTHAFEFWVAYQNQLNNFGDYRKTAGVPLYPGYDPAKHNSIISKLQAQSSFYGTDSNTDFTNWTASEIAYYDDFSNFLGINFKKIFHGIGHAIGWVGSEVGHGVKWVGSEVGHAGHWVGDEAAHGFKFIEHGVEGAALGVAHGARDIGVGGAHVIRDVGVGAAHGLRDTGKFVAHETEAAGKALAPYWKVLVTAAAVVVSIASFGVAAPLAISAGAALLTGLDAIKDNPPLPPIGAGSGGGDPGATGDGAGFPQGEPGNGEGTPEMTEEEKQEAMAQYQAAVKKHHRLIFIISAVSVIGIIIAFMIFHRKSKGK